MCDTEPMQAVKSITSVVSQQLQGAFVIMFV